VAGNKITLQLEGRPVQATIVKTFEPWTFSCAMILSFDSDLSAIGIKGNVVLKLYDRRFSTRLRKLNGVDPWFPEIERDLFKSLCSEEGMKFAIECEKCWIKQIEEDHCFMSMIIEDDNEEQDQQNTCEQEDKKDDGNDNTNSKGTLSRFSMLSMKLLSPLVYAYKMASHGLFCAIRFLRTGVTALFPRGRKIIDIETQESSRNGEASGNNSTRRSHGVTVEQQTNISAAADQDTESGIEEEWDYLCDERFLCVRKQFLYEVETRVYETMKDLQGIHISRIFAHTKILGPKYTQDQPLSRYFEHPGILMEYIEGFPLHNIGENAPRKAWQPIVDNAIEIVNEIMRHGVLNDDTNVRCFIVQPDPANSDSEYKYKLAMIDFGHTSVRAQYSPRDDWRWWQAHDDAEGAIGQIMQQTLERDHGGGYIYTMTPYSQALAKDYMNEYNYTHLHERPMLCDECSAKRTLERVCLHLSRDTTALLR
jgi:hypothetical protein